MVEFKRWRRDRWGLGREKYSRCGHYKIRENCSDGKYVCLVKRGEQWVFFEHTKDCRPVRHRKLERALAVFQNLAKEN